MPEESTPSRVMPAWSRVNQYLDRLFDAIEELDEAGGINAAAEVGRWTPKAKRKVDESIATAIEALERQLLALRQGRTVTPSKKRTK